MEINQPGIQKQAESTKHFKVVDELDDIPEYRREESLWFGIKNDIAGAIFEKTSDEMDIEDRTLIVNNAFDRSFRVAQEAGFELSTESKRDFIEAVLTQVCVAKILEKQGYDIHFPDIKEGAGTVDLIVTDTTEPDNNESGKEVVIPIRVASVYSNFTKPLVCDMDYGFIKHELLEGMPPDQIRKIDEGYLHERRKMISFFEREESVFALLNKPGLTEINDDTLIKPRYVVLSRGTRSAGRPETYELGHYDKSGTPLDPQLRINLMV